MSLTSETTLTVTHNNLRKLLEVYYASKHALMIWGPPGVGKSELMCDFAMQQAHEEKRIFIDWNADAEARNTIINDLREVERLRKELGDALRAIALAEEGSVKDSWISYKTSISEQLASHKKAFEQVWVFVDVRLSMCEPTDLKGLPSIIPGAGVSWEPDKLFRTLSSEGVHGMLLLDELNQASENVQKAAYQLIHNRCAGETTLAPGVMIIAAGNDKHDGGNVHSMSQALMNRMDHLRLDKPSASVWSDWAINKGLAFSVVMFIRKSELDLCDDITSVKKEGHKSFATPRSWARVAQVFNMLPKIKDFSMSENNVHYVTAYASVGYLHASKLIKFLEATSRINVKTYLDRPEAITEVRSIEDVFDIITALVEHLVEIWDKEDVRTTTYIQLMEIMRHMHTSGATAKGFHNAEMAQLFMTMLSTSGFRKCYTTNTHGKSVSEITTIRETDRVKAALPLLKAYTIYQSANSIPNWYTGLLNNLRNVVQLSSLDTQI